MFNKKCLVNFKKLFFEDTRRIQPILNDIVDLHVQAVDHHRNHASIKIRQHPVNVVGNRRRNPTIFLGIWSAQIMATKLVVFRPFGWNLTKTNGFRPVGRIWPVRLDRYSQNIPARTGQKIQAKMVGF